MDPESKSLPPWAYGELPISRGKRLVFLYAPLVRIERVYAFFVTLSYVKILVDYLLSVIGFLVFEHVVDDLNELPGESIHGLPMGFPFSPLSPVVLTGLGVDPDLG